MYPPRMRASATRSRHASAFPRVIQFTGTVNLTILFRLTCQEPQWTHRYGHSGDRCVPPHIGATTHMISRIIARSLWAEVQ